MFLMSDNIIENIEEDESWDFERYFYSGTLAPTIFFKLGLYMREVVL